MWPWWAMIPIEDLTDVALAMRILMTMSDESYQVTKAVKWWKLFSDESLRSWNCQRSVKEWWLVTFRLWRCFCSLCLSCLSIPQFMKSSNLPDSFYALPAPFVTVHALHSIRSSTQKQANSTSPTQKFSPCDKRLFLSELPLIVLETTILRGTHNASNISSKGYSAAPCV